MTIRLAAFLLVFLFLAGQAYGEAWRWTDSGGAVHITGDLDSVPESHRAVAKKIEVENVSTGGDYLAALGDNARGKAELKFTSGKKGIVVPAMFNGSVKRDVIIDTGSEWVAITKKLARAMGYEIGPGAARRKFRTPNGLVTAPVVTLQSVWIGGARVSELPAVVIDFEGRGEVSAVIGMAFLTGFSFEIDTAEKVVRLEASGG